LKGLEVLKELESLVLNQCTLLTSTCLDMLLNHQQVDEKTKLTSTLFPRLKTLELAQCKLKNKTLKAIGTLKQLERLVIRGCQQITDEGLESLAHLKQLRYFDARNCPQICDGPRIEWMATLEVLLLARGGFTECRAAILKDFKSLKELDLRACHKIGRNTFEIIARTCRNLERLVLAETPLDDQSLIQVCQNLRQLTSLDLGSTEITDHGTQAFFQLKKMKRLHLDVSELHNRTLVHISSLCHLEYLDLFGAGISESGLYHLIRLKKLKHLEICNGFIGNRGVKLIAKITSLTSLNLSQNR
jgi:Leucine-rich repeat (LRR) protein